MENIIKQFESDFKKQFPKSYFKATKSTLFDSNKPSYAVYIALKNDNFPNNIIQNDVMYHVISFYTETKGIEVKALTSGLALKPQANSYLAMNIIKTNLRKKTGNAEQINNHLNKWVNNLKTLVVENQDNLYGNAQDYKDFII